ncbi:hypothetical protein EU524_01990 [Candidatus Thorarchaeota archaeon]|nr:MAG: hypothetical protein EU524_01990 [Candidatus Thorarchaeota archaeon]
MTYYTILLLPGVCVVLLLMLVLEKDDRNLTDYWRRMLFLTLLLLFWIHLFSPRGIYKYYLVALVPLLSVFSVSRMIRSSKEKAEFSVFMILNPLLLSLGLLFPSRYAYLAVLLAVFLAYALHKQFSIVHGMLDSGLQLLRSRLALGASTE